MTLLEKVMEIKGKRRKSNKTSDDILRQRCELGLAFMSGLISRDQFCHATGLSVKASYSMAREYVCSGFRHGFCKIEMVPVV